MLDSALRYAERGWFIFPCWGVTSGLCDCKLEDCQSPGKHPMPELAPNGVKNATNDPARIREWWGFYGNANIAVATGEPSGIVVLDADPPNGIKSLAVLSEQYGQLPETLTAATGRDGRHFVYRYFGPCRNRNGFADCLDIKSTGGYIVVEPSLHISGKRYEWLAEIEVAELPQAWADALASAPVAEITKAVSDPIRQGERNSTLASMAGAMRRKGMEVEAIEAGLLEQNKRCDPPLPEREVRAIARSIGRYTPEEGGPAETATLEPRILCLKEVHAGPEPETPWVYPGWLADSDRVFLLGRAKTGKSVLLTDLALALATGSSWVGLPATDPKRVLYVDEEQTEILARQRIKRALTGRGIEGPSLDMAGDNLLYLHRNSLNLELNSRVVLLLDLIRSHNPDFLLIDSLKRIHGRDENSNTEVSEFFRDVLDPLITDRGVGMICLHHAQKGDFNEDNVLDSLRGAGVIGDYADSVWAYLRQGDQRKLVCAVTRWDQTGSPIVVGMDDSKGVSLRGHDASGQILAWVRQALQNSGSAGVLRKELLEDAKEEFQLEDHAAAKAVTRATGSLFHMGEASKERDGRGTRYYARIFAPPTADHVTRN